LPGFEPAKAGGSLLGNAALAQAYRVISSKLRTLLLGIGSKRGGNITNTAGLRVLYHIPKCNDSQKLSNGLTKFLATLDGINNINEKTLKVLEPSGFSKNTLDHPRNRDRFFLA